MDGELILGGRVRLLAMLPPDVAGPMWQGFDHARGQHVVVRELVGAYAQSPPVAHPGQEVVVDAGRVFVLMAQPQTAPPAAPVPARPSRRRWWIIGGVAGGLIVLSCLALIVVGAFYLDNHRPTPRPVVESAPAGPGVNVGALGAKRLDCIRVDEPPQHPDDEVHARIVTPSSGYCPGYVMAQSFRNISRDRADAFEDLCKAQDTYGLVFKFVMWASEDGETGTIFCMVH